MIFQGSWIDQKMFFSGSLGSQNFRSFWVLEFIRNSEKIDLQNWNFRANVTIVPPFLCQIICLLDINLIASRVSKPQGRKRSFEVKSRDVGWRKFVESLASLDVLVGDCWTMIPLAYPKITYWTDLGSFKNHGVPFHSIPYLNWCSL